MPIPAAKEQKDTPHHHPLSGGLNQLFVTRMMQTLSETQGLTVFLFYWQKEQLTHTETKKQTNKITHLALVVDV